MRMSNTRQKENSAFAYDSNIAYECDPLIEIGRRVIEYSFCKALKWKGKSRSMCCNNHKIQVPLLQTPPEPLLMFFSTDSPDEINFQTNKRRYNSCFQMTSFGSGREIREPGFMPTFKVQGQVYHRIDMYAKIQTERLRFIRLNQKKLRLEDYIHLRDAIINNDNMKQIGKPTILPFTFTGSPRYMYERTQDAMLEKYAALWNLHRENMSEDILHKTRITVNNMDLEYNDEIFNRALLVLEDKIKALGGTDLKVFGLPEQLLHEHNALVRMFRTALERMLNNDYKVVIRADKRPAGKHERTFNVPTIDVVAILIVGENVERRDIVFKRCDTRQLQKIFETHRSYDTLQYPLMFWQGNDGYHLNIKMINLLNDEYQ
ncbi:hypothetical protein HNY73_018457 [Argiope bruennichi]|uniref:Helitron helicase-like domain-containing protein n=1 Tax=Argiope bruennichi TaxID=94029 RepID=A0A8T0EEB8_ARGBR|nr:hypothetical protein HNY73_018457 [Argiope bruennichi]